MREMRDSGIQWLGEYPSTWSLKKIKYCLQERIEKNNPVRTTDILSLTAKQGVIPYDQKEGGGNKPKEDFSAYRLAYPGDIVMNSMNILSGSVGLSQYFGCVSPVYYMLRPWNRKEDVRYYNYIFQTAMFQRSLYGLGNGILIKESGNGKLNTIRMRIPMDKFGGLFIPVASTDEQRKIADFLDGKCAEIDGLVADIQSQIDTLEQYKRSVITETVTKGLNPDAEMKDSGIEWVGMIPAHWRVLRIKNMFSIVSGATPSPDIQNWDGDIRWITPADYKTRDKYVAQGKRNLSSEGFNTCSTSIIPRGSIIFSKRAPIGTVAINTEELCTNQGCLSCIPITDCSCEFFYYVMSVGTEHFELLGTGTTFKEISASNFANCKLPTPPFSEQVEIAHYLSEKVSEIDTIIDQKKEQLTVLENYKKSLIYEYVTGKKEVPVQ